MKIKRKLSALLISFSVFALSVNIGLPNLNATGPVSYTNHTETTDISEMTMIFVKSRYPQIIQDKYIGWYGVNKEFFYDQEYSNSPYDLHYINMMDVVNLYTDGTHVILPDGKHKFTFGGNTVIISNDSNKININGKDSFIGKIRYADSKSDKARFGFFLGSKTTYDQSIKSFNTWIPAEAVDEVLDFGLRGLGNNDGWSFVYQAKFGIAVPAQYRVITPWQGLQTYKKQNVADIRYTAMKNLLPEEIKSKIKESTVSNLLFGEDYSNIDNYDQVAKMVKAMFSGITPVAERMISYNDMSESELANEFRRISFENEEQFIDFYCGPDRNNSRFLIRVYFSGFEKRNGISFALYTVKNDNNITPDHLFHTLKSVYPFEMSEFIIKDTLRSPDMNKSLNSAGNNLMANRGVVQAHGKYKWFNGTLPSNQREFTSNITYFLIDNHPAMTEEQFCSSNYTVWELTDMGIAGDNIQEREFRRYEGFYGRGYREDFFTFSEISEDIKAKIGMKEVYDSVNYNDLEISQIARRVDGVTKKPLEKCTNNPYGTYGKLK